MAFISCRLHMVFPIHHCPPFVIWIMCFGVSGSCPPLHKWPRHLPVNLHVLHLLFRVWSHPPVSRDRVMLWAEYCTGFFGFLRSGEFTCPSAKDHSNSMLSAADVGVDSHSNPSFVTIHLRHSKTISLVWEPPYILVVWMVQSAR